MNSIPFNTQNNSYIIHVINNNNYNYYKTILENLNICSPEFISNNYESLSYDMLSEPGYTGFFLTDIKSTIIYSSLVADLECAQLEDKITDKNLLENAVSIIILCSNMNKRIPKLTSSFFQFIIQKLIPKYKTNIKRILLYVTKEDDNPIAISFYKKLGFHFVENYIMSTSYQGGVKRKKLKGKGKNSTAKKGKGKRKSKRV